MDDIWDLTEADYEQESKVSEQSNGNQSEQGNGSTDLINFNPKGTKKLYITKSGAFIKFDYINLALAKKIENYFTLRSKTIIGTLKQLKCCRMDKANKRIIVPRFGVFEILNKKFGLDGYVPISQISPGVKPKKPFKWIAKLTDNQKLLSDEIMTKYFTPSRVANGGAGVIVNLEAGQGKSYLAAYLISLIQKKTAIILHTTALIEQWAKVLQVAFGSSVSIGYYYAKKKKDGDIMIFIIDSASNDTFTIGSEEISALDMYNQFGLIILDECHMYSSKTALTAFRSMQAPYMLGLSATPDEHADGYDRAVWWSIGPILNASQVPGYVATSEDFEAEVHRVMYYGPKEHTKLIVNKTTDMTSFVETINMLCEDEIRNKVIVDCICEGLDLGLFMFVFADRRDYLTILQEQLKAYRQIDSEIMDSDDDFIRIVGGAKSDDLELAEVKSKVIFTTYQYMGTGKSVVKMNGLVLATPRKAKMKQYINRIFRLGSDTSIKRHIWDICDMKLKVSSQWSVRNAYYKSKGYTVTTKKIMYSDVDDVRVGQVVDAEDFEDPTNEDPTNEDPTNEDPTNEDSTNEDSANKLNVDSIVSGLLSKIKRG